MRASVFDRERGCRDADETRNDDGGDGDDDDGDDGDDAEDASSPRVVVNVDFHVETEAMHARWAWWPRRLE